MIQHPPPDLGASSSADNRLFKSGALGLAVIVSACAWTANYWALVLMSAVLQPDIVHIYVILSRLEVLIMLVAYALTTIWLWRTRHNAELINPRQQRWSVIWVWAGWIVPLFSYFVPKQLVDDVWRSTVSTSRELRTQWWWGTWIIMSLALLAGSVAFDDIVEGGGLVIYNLIVAVLTTIGMLFWIHVVRTISDAQDALASGIITPS